MKLKTREKQEHSGECWLPLYVLGTTMLDSTEKHRCFYCGYEVNEGHDSACLYLTTTLFPVHQKFSGKDTIIFVPKGGLTQPAGAAMF